VAIQLVQGPQTNPPVESDVAGPDAVRVTLRRACYDCHSNETVWPWYAKVAPVAWVLAYDVTEGRKVLNFSAWGRLSDKERNELLAESWTEIEEGEMPPWYYVLMHPDAKLSQQDRDALRDWTAGRVSGM
jgi:cytochrome c551/c552